MKSHPNWRGDRRIRVGLEITENQVSLAEMWTLDGPAVQRPSLVGTHIVRVDVNGRVALMQSLDNPLLTRGIAKPDEVGHSYATLDRTTVYVDVPIWREEIVDEVMIRIADLSRVRDRPTDPPALAEIFDRPPGGMRVIASISLAEMTSHDDWTAVARDFHLRNT
jgi:hypothetical protein